MNKHLDLRTVESVASIVARRPIEATVSDNGRLALRADARWCDVEVSGADWTLPLGEFTQRYIEPMVSSLLMQMA